MVQAKVVKVVYANVARLAVRGMQVQKKRRGAAGRAAQACRAAGGGGVVAVVCGRQTVANGAVGV